ncbi:choice-of-anchor J domain-containing protein, partial [Bacteroidales bacterium OttesenSCG-928-K03]|nr:choice-of-anchor J domain-containing protein [Bacteroidales bacterium OttesenSCG-928-K03]
MKQSFIKKLSLITVMLVMTFGAFTPLLAQDNTLPAKNQAMPGSTTERVISEYYEAPAQVEQGSRATQTIFSDGFEGSLTGWMAENLGTGGNWTVVSSADVTGDYLPNSGTYGAANFWASGQARNAWLHSPGFELEAGTTYTISFYLSLPGFPLYTEHDYFEAKIGQAQSAAAMTTELYRNTTTYVSSWTKIEQTFTPTTTGTYYLGFHAFTPTDEGDIISIDDILVTAEDDTLPPVEAGEAVATIQGANVHLAWEPETTTGLTGFEIYRRDCYATDWEGAELIAGNIPAAQTEYMDYSWAAADYGVYNWGVFAYYESAPTAIYSSNCLDKDMITEVDVTVTLNSGEAATGTVVTFTNTSEPDLELEYEVTLDATGKFTWDEFRKGTYDISVVNEWFANVTETDVLIEEEESFVWQLVENIDAPTDLYVTPTAYASWEGSVPGMKDILVTIGEGTATGYDLPMNTFWNFSYNQQIFDADEIGYNEGTIFSVAFQYAYATSFSNDIKIFMANTTKNVFESTSDWVALSELTEVYSGNVTFVNTNEGNWVTIEFDTPFTYTGGNVVLATLDETTGYPGSTRTFYRHTTGGNKSLVSYRDSGGAINPAAPISTSYAYVRDYRNNVQFGINTRSRMAEQYKVFLNGVFVDNTMDPFYQYNVANLTVGEEYLSEVLVDYTTGQSAKAYYTFTYAGCDAYDAPTTLASVQSVGTKNAVLTWTNPDLSDVDYLRVYRNGAVHKNKLSMDTPFTTWTDPELANGTYNYALTLVYDDGAETCLDAATTAITIKSTGTINGTVTYKLGG